MPKWISIARIALVKGQIHHRGDKFAVKVVYSLIDDAWYTSVGIGYLELEFSEEIIRVYNPMRLGNFDVNSVIWQVAAYKHERPISVKKIDGKYPNQ